MQKVFAGVTLITSFYAACEPMPDDFMDMNQVLPEAIYDIRYYTDNNFVGMPVEGYLAPKCILQRQAGQALQNVAARVAEQGMKLKIFDCYRPQRSVAHFMRWAQDLSDTRTKEDYFPNLPKTKLVGEYIAERSGHSRGATVDLTLVRQNSQGDWEELDMASPFDMFDPLSNTANPTISSEQAANRQLLKGFMESEGFDNYSMEWWHYSLVPQPYTDTYFDFPVK
ncbi:M15 family metallopeptidase [Lacimicrobium alkaliphilum]|uniref:D-alanyl-D-alanine dipeptidase n=1 Tax=Lacimicrobium alkaliphilum TaxID=1526571 RepID=A0ABQ1RPD3_9ALTE|nr:M15 family metallopeptidase [Lacimicrobium alkaliphilum]GGD75042.1 D-alanyl-D-alanine dipeptidase [Lacimicrobium alkaliphilum]